MCGTPATPSGMGSPASNAFRQATTPPAIATGPRLDGTPRWRPSMVERGLSALPVTRNVKQKGSTR
ncbi:hypothetical protein GCM10018785_34660 [Streptomyces longispororuber]|uniref:Uncharacterized protein n=2 Tax=Streptomyces longispororuber TaxID=68230 RepID=A0A919DNF2_9ACTN|nr:hypothetical protein GCM10018785_34660 [Streptomyces longispororuber]